MVCKLEAVIFDMDGLMIDSEHLHSRSIEIVLNRYGVEPTLNKYGIIQTLGIGVAGNFEKLKKKYKLKPSVDKLTEEKHEAYQNLIPKIKPMKGLKPLLKNLSQANIKMAVASGESKKNIKTILKQLDIDKYFDAIVSGEEVSKPKPAPDVFLQAVKDLKVNANNCVVLEDAPSGIVAANKAGMKSVAIFTEFNHEHKFARANAIFNSLEEINIKKLRYLFT